MACANVGAFTGMGPCGGRGVRVRSVWHEESTAEVKGTTEDACEESKRSGVTSTQAEPYYY
jgi:hypothetical protein